MIKIKIILTTETEVDLEIQTNDVLQVLQEKGYHDIIIKPLFQTHDNRMGVIIQYDDNPIKQGLTQKIAYEYQPN